MKTTITVLGFIDAFHRAGRHDNFSDAGLRALFSDLGDWEEDTGEEFDLDVISLCCDYCEYSSAVEAATECGDWAPGADLDDDDKEAAALEWLRDRRTVIEVGGSTAIILGF